MVAKSLFIQLQNIPGKMFKSSLVKQTVKLSIISMFANFLGFLIPIYIAYVFGISKDTDEFFFSYAMILFAGTILTGAVRSVVIPFLAEKMADKESFNKFISSLFYYSFYALSIVSLLLFIVFMTLHYYGSNNLFLYMAVSVPVFFFTVQNAICYGILNTLNQFYIAETSPFSKAIIVYLSIFLLQSKLGIMSVIIGFNLGEIAKFFHLAYVIRYKNNIRFSKKWVDYQEIKSFIKQGGYQAASTSITSASVLIDKVVASFLIIGSLSILDYGNRLFMVFHVLFNSFLIIILSKWSKEVAKNQFDIKKMNKTILIVFLLTTLAFLAMTFMHVPIVNLLYPKLDQSARGLISIVLLLNMAAFIFNAINQIINRATIAYKATRILIKTAIIKTIVNIILDIIFALQFGVIGIAIATILVNLVGFFVNYILFIKQQKTVATAS